MIRDREVFDVEQAGRDRRESERQRKLALAQDRADFQDVLNMPGARRILWLFLQEMGVDRSAFSTNAMAMARNTALQEAGSWWLTAIRLHCPEKEAQIRREAMAAASTTTNEEEPE